ncbi:hypothetical protein GGF43_005559, partial [Coemansia sp. RSA 2618]
MPDAACRLGHISRTQTTGKPGTACRHYHRPKASTHNEQSPPNDQPWSQAIPYNVAERLLAEYDAQIEAARARIRAARTRAEPKDERHALEMLLLDSQPNNRAGEHRGLADPGAPVISGRNMPSSVMRRLNLKFYTDIRRRRQQQGLRVQVLGVLSRLRHLIGACARAGDRSGRVFVYLEVLNQHYANALRYRAPVLRLRSANSMTLGTYTGHEPIADATPATRPANTHGPTIVVAANDTRQQQVQQMLLRPTRFTKDTATSPLFDRKLFVKRRPRGSDTQLDARAACWVDYLVDDLGEADAHRLFILVARSKVPEQAHSQYRAAIEEALALAFNRRGYALDPLESLRVCVHFMRQLKNTGDECAVHFRQICMAWRHAGKWCVEELRGELDGDDAAIGELRFKRWNNVASEALAWRAQGDMQGACELLGEWHSTWTRIMHTLCPDRRRGFADGTDPFAFPFWRPKRPGVLRLHELTLSTNAVESLLKRMVEGGLVVGAAEALGLATSEIGVPVKASMFNIVLGGLAADARPRVGPVPRLRDLLVPTNARALDVYTAGDGDELAQVLALLRGLVR